MIPSVLFVTLLVLLHVSDLALIPRPLSTLRDGPTAPFGYALFVFLLFMGIGYVALYIRARAAFGMIVPFLCVILFAYVAATPSFDADHGIASILLLMLLFFYYAIKLYFRSSFWFFAHIATPFVILGLTRNNFQYGVIQKSLILYFVLAVNLDMLFLVGWDLAQARNALAKKPPKKAYHLKLKRR
jgi:hypothetical protein